MSTDPELDADDAWRAAADRFDFQLHYVRSPDPRRIDHHGCTLVGPAIENAYLDQPAAVDVHGRAVERLPLASGHWEEPDPPLDREGQIIAAPTAEDYLRKYVGMAVAEGVHETLEWLRVDGRPYLDPHGPSQDRIHRAVERLVRELHELHTEDHERGPAGRRRGA